MVVLSNSIDNENISSPSPSRNLQLLERLKRARAEQQAKLNNEQKESEKSQKKVTGLKKLSRTSYNSSGSSTEPSEMELLIKRSTMQEKLFSMQCQQLKQKNLERHFSNLQSSSSSSEQHYRCNKIQGNTRRNPNNGLNNNKNKDSSENTTSGVLHLKGNIKNIENEKIYYESHGRMAPMNWDAFRENQEKSNNKNDLHKVQNGHLVMHDKINNSTMEIKREVSPEFLSFEENSITCESKSEVSAEFLNFVENSITCETVYGVKGNLEQIKNAIDSPMLKVQRLINIKSKDVLQVSQEMKKAFEPPVKSQIHVIDKIDSRVTMTVGLLNKLKSLQSKKSTSQTTSEYKENSKDMNQNQPSITKLQESPNIYDFNSRDNLSLMSQKNVSMTCVKKKRALDEYDDDMFTFVKPTPKVDSRASESLLNSRNNDESTLNKTSSSNSIPKSYFNKLKISCFEKKQDTTLDSDDMSLDNSSLLSDLSASRRSSFSRFERLKQKVIRNTATQYSPKNNEKIDTSVNVKLNDDSRETETEKSEFLLKESSTHYFKKSEAVTDEDNVVEDKNIRVTPNEEMLLKSVFTRYFAKPLTEEEISRKVEETDSSLNTSEESNVTAMKNMVHQEKTENDQNENLAIESNDSSDKVSTMNTDSSNDCDVIYHEHKNITENSVIIEEIDCNVAKSKNEDLSNADESKKMPSPDSTTLNNFECHQTEINSDDEFDVVGIDGFVPYKTLLNQLKAVRAAQKAIITGEVDSEDEKLLGIEKSNSNLKAIESSFEGSDNNYSKSSVSASSNADTGSLPTKFTDSSDLFQSKNNIFENVVIDESILEDSPFNYYNMESKALIVKKVKPKASNKIKKMKNALKSYKNNLNSTDIGEGSEPVQQSDVTTSNESLTTKEKIRRYQILSEIKKLKLHLHCKPMMQQN